MPLTVPVGQRKPSDCTHGWLRDNGQCVFCGSRHPISAWPAPALPYETGTSLRSFLEAWADEHERLTRSRAYCEEGE